MKEKKSSFFLRSLLSTIVGIVLAAVSGAITGAFKGAAEASVQIGLVVGFFALACLAISYRRHRKKSKTLASEAMRISRTPSANPAEWQKMLYQSKQGWQQGPKIQIVLLGVFSWVINSVFSKIIGSDPLDWTVQVSTGVSVMGQFVQQHIEERQEMAEFELSLEAANKGYWYPAVDLPEEQKTAKVELKDFATNLPSALLDAAAEGMEDKIKEIGPGTDETVSRN